MLNNLLTPIHNLLSINIVRQRHGDDRQRHVGVGGGQIVEPQRSSVCKGVVGIRVEDRAARTEDEGHEDWDLRKEERSSV